VLGDRHPDALEDLLGLEIRHRERGQELGSVEPVCTVTVGGHRSGRGGIGNQGAARGVDGGEPPRAAAESSLEGIVTAGVEHDEVDAVAGERHFLEHHLHVHALESERTLARDLGIHG
jgi:hypothetical protein